MTHVEHLRVAWADTDASGRIHWSVVLRWAELAEHRLLGGLGRGPADAGGYPRRAAEVVYHRALAFDDRFDLRLDVEEVGTTSVTFAWAVVRDEEVCVEGRHTVVHVDGRGRPGRWPEDLRRELVARVP